MTVAETLKTYAASRGLMFWLQPDATLVFGRPMTGGKATYRPDQAHRQTVENNIIEGEEVTDISKQYSKVTVIGQQQGTDAITPAAINTSIQLRTLAFRSINRLLQRTITMRPALPCMPGCCSKSRNTKDIN